ncbi:DUF6531 domain-containing protein, partial [Variovorax sp. KK3]
MTLSSARECAGRRLRVRGMVAALVMALSTGSHAFAAEPAPTGFALTSRPIVYPTMQDACDAFLPIAQSWNPLAGYESVRLTPGNFPVCHAGANNVYDLYTGVHVTPPNCPANSLLDWSSYSCKCGVGTKEDPASNTCVPAPVAEPEAGQMCSAGLAIGQPILPATGEKYRFELDYADGGPAPLSFSRIYRSTWWLDASRPSVGLGQVWSHNHGAALKVTSTDPAGSVTITSPEGYLRTFVRSAQSPAWSATNSADTLVQTADGLWVSRRADGDQTLRFDASGKLVSSSSRNGWITTYDYDIGGRLARVANAFGRSLRIAYNASGQLATVITADGRVIGYAYDRTGRLAGVTYPDGGTRSFVYEKEALPQALTGIFDEGGARWGSFAYDAVGRATLTELSGGVNRYEVRYQAAGGVDVTDPLSTTRRFIYGTANGKLAVTGASRPSGEFEADAASRTQDANGLITSETDFKGVVTTTTWDTARRLPLSVTRAAGTPQAQTTTTQWHPIFSLPTLVTEAGRTVATTYDDKGNVLT